MYRAFFLTLLFSTNLFANGLIERAFEQYAKRDYNEEGIISADNARYNFDQVLTKLYFSRFSYT